MKSGHLSTVCAVAALIIVSAISGRAQQTPASGNPPASQLLAVQGGQIRVVTLASGLVHPWSIAFLPDGSTMLVAEKNGRLRILRNGALDAQPIWTAPAPPPAAGQGRGQGPGGGQAAGQGAQAAPQDGRGQGAQAPGQGGRGQGGQGQGAQAQGGDTLHSVAVHPQFAQNRLVYVSYPKQGERGSTLAIARGRLDGATLTDVREIFVADAWETGGNLAGRILFGPDGTLYVTVGDRDRLCCIGRDDNSLRIKAQALDNHVGKILRIRDDGTVPPDNPFVGRAGAKPEIFTYGHRNGYGLAFHPETGELWEAEIGPLGGDELNILLPGRNYGWPLVSMGRNYTGSLVSDEPWWRNGMENPRMFWVPSISPSSIAFYTGDRFPRWKGSLLVGALNGQQLQRVSFNQPSQAERREPVLAQLKVRIRDVQQGPDGYIYVATELGSGGNNPDGTVLKIEPADAPTSSAAK
jgi:glucose/arabinose dehydrogenase